MLGSNQHLGEYQGVPEKYQAAIRHGVNFFELRFPSITKYPKTIMGPYDVTVTERINPVNHKVAVKRDWITDAAAQVRYEIVNANTGLAVAFMCDDEFWHNRLIILDNPGFDVFAYYTAEGIVPGQVIKQEIECLRDVVCEKRPVFHAVSESGRIIKSANDEREIEELLRARPDLKRQTSFVKVKTSYVRELISKYSRQQFGWTSSPEFKMTIVPKVEQLYKTRGISRAIAGAAAISQDMVNSAMREILKGLTPESLRQIQQQIQNEETPAPPQPAESDEMDNETSETEASTETKTGNTAIHRMKKDQLILRAEELGIPVTDGLTRDQLIDIILREMKNKKDEEITAT
jgi:hypothetical protein